MSNLVDSWLNGIGLGYAVPIFAGQGINSPDMLSELDVVDFPELGISDQNDRKKLFYLIQRVKLALARGRAAESKAAPQADSAVSSAATGSARTVVAAGAGQRETAAAAAAGARDEAASSGAYPAVRFRRELEVPTSRAALSPRTGAARKGPSAAGGGGPSTASAAGAGRLTPAKAQRLPPSHRRPKTPHADGTARGAQHQQTTGRLAVGARTSGAAPAGERNSKAQAAPEEQQGEVRSDSGSGSGSCGGGGGRETAASDGQQPSRPKRLSKPYEQHRSALEPVQLDEAGGRTRLSSSSSSSSAAANAERALMPPPPSVQHRNPAAGRCAAESVSSTEVAPRSQGTTAEGGTSSALSGGHAVAVVKTVPARPPSDAKEQQPPGAVGGGRRRDAPPPRQATAVAVAIPASPRTQEVARLYPSRRDTAAAATAAGARSTRDKGRAVVPDVPDSPGPASSTPKAGAGRGECIVGGGGGASWAQGAAAANNGRRESAAELAVHLISAHREDVRSALAAARRDMDLVSKADQDRQPAALLEYAREVEGVLHERMAAGNKLKKALEEYMELRQAGMASGAAKPRPGVHGLQEGRLQTEGRALQA